MLMCMHVHVRIMMCARTCTHLHMIHRTKPLSACAGGRQPWHQAAMGSYARAPLSIWGCWHYDFHMPYLALSTQTQHSVGVGPWGVDAPSQGHPRGHASEDQKQKKAGHFTAVGQLKWAGRGKWHQSGLVRGKRQGRWRSSVAQPNWPVLTCSGCGFGLVQSRPW